MPARIDTRTPPLSANMRVPRNRRRARNAPLSVNSPATPGALCSIAARLAASHYEVTLADIGAPTRRSRRAARARYVAMYLAHITYGIGLTQVGVAFGRSRRLVARACGMIEDARDDPAFDAALAALESSARIFPSLEGAEKAA